MLVYPKVSDLSCAYVSKLLRQCGDSVEMVSYIPPTFCDVENFLLIMFHRHYQDPQIINSVIVLLEILIRSTILYNKSFECQII